jgi:hypothetical protein
MPKRTRKPPPKPKQRGRKPAIKLARRATHKPVSAPLNMPRAEIHRQLTDAIASCRELFGAHGPECACDLCALVSSFVGSVEIYRMLVEIT